MTNDKVDVLVLYNGSRLLFTSANVSDIMQDLTLERRQLQLDDMKAKRYEAPGRSRHKKGKR